MQIRFGWMKALAFSILVLACAIRSPATSLAQTSEQVAFFESEIRPILVEHCYGCHGPDKQKGNLRLDSLATMIQGGESGPALIPGDAASSLLVQAIRYESLQMPPNGKLAPRKVEALARWIDAKAPVSPEFAKAPASRQPIEETARDREHWSFQPIRVLAPPLPENRVDSNALQPKTEAINQPTNHHPIDRWVHDRLQREGISPLPRASTRELVRRLFFDLTGLPPNYTELQAWIERIGEGPQSFREDEI